MWLKCLKKTLMFSVVAMGLFAFVLSCENPFSNNLGAKVDVEYPTITGLTPRMDTYLSGSDIEFEGEASAYRELTGVRVRIFNENNREIQGWTNKNLEFTGGDIKKKSWRFTLDTLDFFESGEPLEDGTIYIEFQATDPNLHYDTGKIPYYIKNGPSKVTLARPDQRILDEGGETKLLTGTELRGTITDPQGIKPGWPRIKFWKATDPEPAVWKILPLKWGQGEDTPDDDDGSIVYEDRDNMRVVRTASFSYRLAKPDTTNTTTSLKYAVATPGSYENLPVGEYRFKIETWDSYFIEDSRPEYITKPQWPRPPDGGAGEAEKQGLYPSTGYYTVTLTTGSAPPAIELNNKDIAGGLPAAPHIYFPEGSNVERKIKRATGSDFRLRVFATHPSNNIIKATLKYSHGGFERYLQWTGATSVDNYAGQTVTYDGVEGKAFTLEHNVDTQINAATFTTSEGLDTIGGGSSAQFLFPSRTSAAPYNTSTEPYYLTVEVFAGEPSAPSREKKTYTLYIDGEDPTVSIRTIKGAFSEPDSVNNYYTVNGNVRVTADSTDNMGMQKDGTKPVVKWTVDTVPPTDPNSTATKLADYKLNPTKANRAFFDDIADIPASTTTRSGWVNGTTNSFVFNTTQFTNFSHVYLYIIAEDMAGNLGCTSPNGQQLYIDQSSDNPTLDVSELVTTITNKTDLEVTVAAADQAQTGNTSKANELSGDPNISVSFGDDDGINLTGGLTGGVTITLTNELTGPYDTLNNTQLTSRTLTTAQLQTIFSGNSGSRNGTLTGAVLAPLVGGTGTIPDGFYRLTITVRDDNAEKERITGDTYITQKTKTATFYFYVYTELPIITITEPKEGVQQNKNAITISGTVQSRLQSQANVWLTFEPDVITPANPAKTYNVPLTLASGPDTNGYYTYNWSRPNVSFIPDGLTYSGFPKFTVTAYDRVGKKAVEVRTVPVDTQGPAINLEGINRSIVRVRTTAPAISIPGAAQFPSDWPLDFPIGTQWKATANTTWTAFRTAYGVDNWPSEYAFMTPADVNAKLTAENTAAPTVVYVTGDGNPSANVPLSGTFQDSVSNMWPRTGPAPAPINMSYEYRFDSDGAIDLAPWSTANMTNGTNNMTANWTFNIPATLLDDGEHTFDIKAMDSVGNESVIYGLRFIVDRNNPYFGAADTPENDRNKPDNFTVNTNMTSASWSAKTETERVFSAATLGNNTNKVFQLRGKVFEHNPDKLTITIGTDSTTGTPYLVTAVYDFQATTQPFDLLINTPGTDRRLTVDLTNAPEYVWTLDIYEKDLAGLKTAAPSDSTRRYIKTIISDRANRRSATSPVEWFFKLDSKSPVIDYVNIETNGSTVMGGTFNGTDSTDIVLKGTVNDETKIKEIRYKIAKWDYTANAWRWYSGGAAGTWSVTAIPATTAWDLYTTYTSGNDSVVNLVINRTMLNAATASYPQDIFATEGKYRLDLYVTDWSMGYGAALSGNPYDTTTVSPNPPNATSAIFFVDRTAPTVAWTGTTLGTPTVPADFYYNALTTNDLRNPFTFNVPADANTITGITAKVAGTVASTDYTTPVMPVTLNTTNGGSGAYSYAPFMTSNGLTGGPRFPDGTYTLTLTVTDGAGRDYAITKQFVLDTTAPVIATAGTALNPPQNSVLLGANVGFSGGVQDDSNQFRRVMYYVASGAGYAAPTAPAATATDAQLKTAGWHWFGDDDNGAYPSANPTMAIDNGTHAWKFTILDTRPLGALGTGSYVNWSPTLSAPTVVRPTEITAADQNGTLTVYFVAIDLAGNVGTPVPVTYWIWPEGDRPKVETIAYPSLSTTLTTPPSTPPNITVDQDKINGIFSIRGIAQDNERVKYVWFRVLKGTTPVQNLKIDTWDTTAMPWVKDTNAGYQLPQQAAAIGNARPAGTGYPTADAVGDGWYMAQLTSGSGSTKAAYQASIDSGDLQITGDYQDITIEVRVEDMRISDEEEDRSTLDKGYLSYKQTAYARIVMNAPKFKDEMAYQGPSSSAGTNWRSVDLVHLRGTQASYKVTVTHDVKLNAIFWSKAQMDQVTPDGEGIVFSAATQRDALPGDSTALEDTNLGISVKLFKTTADTEWDIIVDVDTEKLINRLQTQYTAFTGNAVRYPLYFYANDASGSAPLTASFIAYLPIDNKAPTGRYTINRRPAGSNVAIGGDATDTGDVSGLDRVVLWFSRTDGTTWTPASWRENDANPQVPFTSISAFNATDDWTKDLAFGTTNNLTGLDRTYIPAIPLATATTGGNSAIVIDRHSPNSKAAHHGNDFYTGFSAGGNGQIWYVELDTRKITSGPIYINYVIVDKAGNAAFFRDRLVIMNDAPFINRVTLATDLRRDAGLTNGVVGPGGSGVTNTVAHTTGSGNIFSVANSPFERIKTLVTNRDSTATTNSRLGIADPINITTRSSGSAWKADDYFTVRNALLALRVETDAAPGVNKERTFRVEYVAQARILANTATSDAGLQQVKAGRVYIINNAGTNVDWGLLGAPSSGSSTSTWVTGFAFMAAVDGRVETATPNVFAPRLANTGACSVWELNWTGTGEGTSAATGALTISNAEYTGSSPANANAVSAEFAYKNAAATGGAFGTTANTTIVDDTAKANTYPTYLLNGVQGAQTYATSRSLFMVKVFDGPEADAFADFALIAIPINNNDRTAPSAQLYDLNPKTEGQDEELTNVNRIAPKIDDNRARGGVYNTDVRARTIAKSGHIEPRKTTSLTSLEMGGAADPASATLNEPYADRNYFFTTDTVSGQVILRGRSWDQERVQQINLLIGSGTAVNTTNFIPILTFSDTTAAGTPTAAPYRSTGLLQVPTAVDGRVYFTDTLDLKEGHTVEWAYVWDTQAVPSVGTTIVGNNISVRVVSYNLQGYNASGTVANALPADAGTNKLSSTVTAPAKTGIAGEGEVENYQRIAVNLRPYITGFLRDQSQLFHNNRSRQGRYIFMRGETVIVTGFNIGGTGNTNIYLPGAANARIAVNNLAAASTAQQTSHNTPSLTTPTGASGTNNTRYRAFTVTAATVVTGNGLVTLSVNNFSAANTQRAAAGEGSSETDGTGNTIFTMRPLNGGAPVIQPWNIEYDPGKDGSTLWDDYTRVHIWRSDATQTNTANTYDNGVFRKSDFTITYPSMSIDPRNGTLWASHQEGGRKPHANFAYPGGGAFVSNNGQGATLNPGVSGTGGTPVLTAGLSQYGSFSEHLTYTNMHVGATGDLWAIANPITQAGNDRWNAVGGMWLWGPVNNYASNRGNPRTFHGPRTGNNDNGYTTANDTPYEFLFPTGTGHYAVESLWYNGADNSRAYVDPPNLEQFHNPHIVTDLEGDYAHVAYFDNKDGSLKYRYNAKITTNDTDPDPVYSASSYKHWVNLDGGADIDDWPAYNAQPGTIQRTQTGSGNTIRRSVAGYNPNGTYTEDGASAINSPYGNGVEYQLNSTGINVAAGNLTGVHVQNGSYVTTDTVIYTVGGASVKSPTAGFVILNYKTPTNANLANNVPIFRVYAINGTGYGNRIAVNNGNDRTFPATGTNTYNPHVTGRYNSIAVTNEGYPVIAYYDETTQGLKLAVSNSKTPTTAANWKVFNTGVIFAGADNSQYATGTGEYVSLQISTSNNVRNAADTANIANPEYNYFHIAAMNAFNKNVVYIKGKLNVSTTLASYTLSAITVQVVDNVGSVGNWCKLSLDKFGNPWIAYMDIGYSRSKDGVKVAYKNTARFTKGAGDEDMYGTNISGWEAMHVPTHRRVEDAELGMERFPTIRNITATRGGGLANFAAVGFLGDGYYNIAYYIE
jgi:hypothetical protein